jgi:hypothetical protein
MNMLILSAEEKTELDAVNYGGNPTRQLVPVPLGDGRFALNADLLSDCGPGQTWEYYGTFVGELPIETVASLPEASLA